MKLVLASFIPLTSDEAYYWVWGQNLQLSYFDHPPMVGWLFFLAELTQNLNLTPRWPFVVLGQASILIWICLLNKFFTEKEETTFLVLAFSSFLLGIGSIFGTPDVPVVFFWSLASWLFYSYLQKPRSSYAFLLGLALGFGFLSKYHIVLLLPVFVLTLAFTKDYKKIPFKDWLLVFFAGLLSSLPVLVWNHQNDYVSFLFQFRHGFQSDGSSLFGVFHFIFGQLLMLSPFLVLAAWHSFKTNRLPLFFSVSVFFPFMFFFLAALRDSIEANWTIIALFPLIALATKSYQEFKRGIQLSVGYFAALTGFLLFLVFVPQSFSPRKLLEPQQFTAAQSLASNRQPLYLHSYQMASYFWYHTKVPHFKLRGMSRFDMYDLWEGSQPTSERFYLLTQPGHLPKPETLPDYELLRTVEESTEFIVLEYKRK